MGYYIDLKKISIDQYRDKLTSGYLAPSRMILKEQPLERFNRFKNIGIKNADDLLALLKNKSKISELEKEELFSGDYLKILLRELGSLHTKPNKLADFTIVSKDTIEKLEKIGIKHTEKLFYRVLNENDRKKLSTQTGTSEADILMLTKLTDLSRIRWVGATFAQMIYAVGIDTVEKVTQTDPEDLHREINTFNKEHSIYKGHIGLNDMKILVTIAKEIPLDIEY